MRFKTAFLLCVFIFAALIPLIGLSLLIFTLGTWPFSSSNHDEWCEMPTPPATCGAYGVSIASRYAGEETLGHWVLFGPEGSELDCRKEFGCPSLASNALHQLWIDTTTDRIKWRMIEKQKEWPSRRLFARLAHHPSDSSVMMVGGIDESGNVLTDVWMLKNAFGSHPTWKQITPDLDQPIYSLCSVVTFPPLRSAVVVGPMGTILFEDERWKNLASPPPVSSHVVDFDSHGNALGAHPPYEVVYLRSHDALIAVCTGLLEVWSWQQGQSQWHQISILSSSTYPWISPTCFWASLVWDEGRRAVVGYGGATAWAQEYGHPTWFETGVFSLTVTNDPLDAAQVQTEFIFGEVLIHSVSLLPAGKSLLALGSIHPPQSVHRMHGVPAMLNITTGIIKQSCPPPIPDWASTSVAPLSFAGIAFFLIMEGAISTLHSLRHHPPSYTEHFLRLGAARAGRPDVTGVTWGVFHGFTSVLQLLLLTLFFTLVACSSISGLGVLNDAWVLAITSWMAQGIRWTASWPAAFFIQSMTWASGVAVIPILVHLGRSGHGGATAEALALLRQPATLNALRSARWRRSPFFWVPMIISLLLPALLTAFSDNLYLWALAGVVTAASVIISARSRPLNLRGIPQLEAQFIHNATLLMFFSWIGVLAFAFLVFPTPIISFPLERCMLLMAACTCTFELFAWFTAWATSYEMKRRERALTEQQEEEAGEWTSRARTVQAVPDEDSFDSIDSDGPLIHAPPPPTDRLHRLATRFDDHGLATLAPYLSLIWIGMSSLCFAPLFPLVLVIGAAAVLFCRLDGWVRLRMQPVLSSVGLAGAAPRATFNWGLVAAASSIAFGAASVNRQSGLVEADVDAAGVWFSRIMLLTGGCMLFFAPLGFASDFFARLWGFLYYGIRFQGDALIRDLLDGIVAGHRENVQQRGAFIDIPDDWDEPPRMVSFVMPDGTVYVAEGDAPEG